MEIKCGIQLTLRRKGESEIEKNVRILCFSFFFLLLNKYIPFYVHGIKYGHLTPPRFSYFRFSHTKRLI